MWIAFILINMENPFLIIIIFCLFWGVFFFFFSLEDAQQCVEVIKEEKEEVKKEEPKIDESKKDEDKKATPTPMDTSDDVKKDNEASPMETEPSPAPEPTPPSTPAPVKTKRVIRRVELGITANIPAPSPSILSQWREYEGQMIASDRLVLDTAEKRNALEEYVYESRSKIEMAWSEFVNDADKETFLRRLTDMEDWLYGEGEDATKSVYISKLEELKVKKI